MFVRKCARSIHCVPSGTPAHRQAVRVRARVATWDAWCKFNVVGRAQKQRDRAHALMNSIIALVQWKIFYFLPPFPLPRLLFALVPTHTPPPLRNPATLACHVTVLYMHVSTLSLSVAAPLLLCTKRVAAIWDYSRANVRSPHTLPALFISSYYFLFLFSRRSFLLFPFCSVVRFADGFSAWLVRAPRCRFLS